MAAFLKSQFFLKYIVHLAFLYSSLVESIEGAEFLNLWVFTEWAFAVELKQTRIKINACIAENLNNCGHLKKGINKVKFFIVGLK